MNCRALPLIFALSVLLPSRIGEAVPPSYTDGRQNTVEALGERRTATIHWDNVPLCDGLQRLEKALACSIFLDRRVDPNQVVSLNVADADADEILTKIAAATSLGVSHLGAVKYLGPQAAADQLRTLAALREEEVAQLVAGQRRSLEGKRELVWPQLTEPRNLIEVAIQDRSWRVRSAERIPHDLWAAGSLPELSLADQLTLMLIAFDLTFRLSSQDGMVEIVPLEGPVTLRRQYRLRNASEDANLLRQQFAETQVQISGNVAAVEARVEDHERLLQLMQDRTTRLPQNTTKQKLTQVYTLRVQDQPVGNVLRQLAQRLNWAIEIDEQAIRAAGLSLDQRISFAVENARQEELLKAALHPAGLDYQRIGERFQIVPQRQERENNPRK